MSNIRGRLARLEREMGPVLPTFPFWEMVAGVVRLNDWLAANKFANPLAALRAGVPGAGLDIVALDWWLESNGYSSPGEAVTAGALDKVPQELEAELRTRALVNYCHQVGDCILGCGHWRGQHFRPTLEEMDQWHRIRDYLGKRPVPPPDDTLLTQARQLAQNVTEGARRQRTGTPSG
jgi:hypothetical protein